MRLAISSTASPSVMSERRKMFFHSSKCIFINVDLYHKVVLLLDAWKHKRLFFSLHWAVLWTNGKRLYHRRYEYMNERGTGLCTATDGFGTWNLFASSASADIAISVPNLSAFVYVCDVRVRARVCMRFVSIHGDNRRPNRFVAEIIYHEFKQKK